MEAEQPFASIYRPNHDERVRQSFVGAMKGYLNGPLEKQLARRYEQVLKPRYGALHGGPPQNRQQGCAAFADDHLYQLWGAAVYQSQNLMWRASARPAGGCCRNWSAASRALAPETSLGRLELNPDCQAPEPIRHVAIHRQPGGYFGAAGESDLQTGLLYFGAVELYRNAKGLSTDTAPGEPGMGYYILNAVQRRFPDLQPTAVLDLGCGPGTETVAYRNQFPEAEVWGLDLSAPFLKFAHIWAEDAGKRINFRQADARSTGFDAQSFDLIVSNILFHETWHDVLPSIMREAHRLLRPGGVFLNNDVPYQPGRLDIPSQVTNHWQVANNGEPFWSGFADMDMRTELSKAGFADDEIFADYDPLGQGCMHVFGARKPR